MTTVLVVDDDPATPDPVLAALPHPVYWKDRDGRYLGANQAFLVARGLDRAFDLVGRTEVELPVHDAFTMTLPPIEQSVLETGMPATGVQSLTRTPTPDAEASHGPGPGPDADPDADPGIKILLTVVPMRAASGGVWGVLGVGADVSDLIEIDRTVSHASRLESIGRLAANIAHRINTPVQFITDNTRFVANGVATALSALQAIQAVVAPDDSPAEAKLAAVRDVLAGLDLDFLDDEIPPALLHSLEGLSQIAQLVSTLTDFARVESEMVAANLNRAIDNAVHMTLHEWSGSMDLRLDLDPDLGDIPCFEGELRQVITTVISNAAQAITARLQAGTDATEGLIHVSTRRCGDTARIVVRDNGCGMDEQARARIFDPFFTTKSFGQAAGLGLSLAHFTVVSRHHGSIEVETAPGRGSAVTIVLPLERPAASPTPARGVDRVPCSHRITPTNPVAHWRGVAVGHESRPDMASSTMDAPVGPP